MDVALNWLVRLHFGRWRSHTLKVVWVLLGLIPAGMFVTGAVMWWNRVVRKPRTARVRQPGVIEPSAGTAGSRMTDMLDETSSSRLLRSRGPVRSPVARARRPRLRMQRLPQQRTRLPVVRPQYVIRKPTRIVMGGYGPATTGFSLALKKIGDRVTAKFGKDVDVKYIYNILNLGYLGEDILWLVESGVLTLGYQSSSYLTERVPISASPTCRSCFPTPRPRAPRWTGSWDTCSRSGSRRGWATGSSAGLRTASAMSRTRSDRCVSRQT